MWKVRGRRAPGRAVHRLVLLGAVVGLIMLGCAPYNSGKEDSRQAQFEGEYPIRAVATTGQVAELIRSIGGNHLDVTGLMGPGVDPHLYTAVPKDIERLAKTDIIFYNGLHLEGRLAELLEKLARRKPAHAVTQGLVDAEDPRLLKPPEFEGFYDPHIWHDPLLWGEAAKYVTNALSEFDPAHHADYERNLDAFLEQLQQLDAALREQLAHVPEDQRVLVTAHDAFAYFCAGFGWDSLPLKGVSTEDEVTIGRMDEVIMRVVEKRIKAVFVESATAPQIVRALIEPCRERGHEVVIGGELYADALGPPESGADTYFGMMKSNVNTIVSSLK